MMGLIQITRIFEEIKFGVEEAVVVMLFESGPLEIQSTSANFID